VFKGPVNVCDPNNGGCNTVYCCDPRPKFKIPTGATSVTIPKIYATVKVTLTVTAKLTHVECAELVAAFAASKKMPVRRIVVYNAVPMAGDAATSITIIFLPHEVLQDGR
jgi:hypothetical protein